MMRKYYSIIVFLFSTFLSQAQESALQTFLNKDILKRAQIGVLFYNSSTHQEDLSYHSESGLIPASNMKLLTTAAALDILGADFSFNTQVYTYGDKELIIVGYGDPTFEAAQWGSEVSMDRLAKNIANELKKDSIDCIEKLILSNNGADFMWHNPDWPYSDLGNYYGIGAGPFNIFENMYRIKFNTNGELGAPTKINSTDPAVPLIIENHVTIAPPGTGDRSYIYGDSYTYDKQIRGTLPRGRTYTIKGALSKPDLVFGQILKEKLEKQGIQINGKVKIHSDYDLDHKKLIYVWHSPELKDIVKVINRESHNMFAEGIYFYLNNYKRKEFEAWKNEWKGKIPFNEIQWKDGCGLSPFNRVAPRDFVSLLQKYKKDEAFRYSLANPNRNGTLYKRYNSLIYSDLYAKTGSIEGVYCLSGYVKNKKGEDLIFSIMINNYQGSFWSMMRETEKFLRQCIE